MAINLKPWLGMLCGGIGGALVGWSQILCVNGQCAITGTWIGGALMGSVMGFLLFGFILGDQNNPAPEPQSTPKPDPNEQANSPTSDVTESSSS